MNTTNTNQSKQYQKASIQCRISGLSWSLPDTALLSCHQFYSSHPVFNLSRHQLVSLISKNKSHSFKRLSKQDFRLLFLALVNSTELVTWDCPVSTSYGNLIAQHSLFYKTLPSLVTLIEGLETIPSWPKSQADNFPKLVISDTNNDLLQIADIIQEWLSCLADYASHYILAKQQQKERLEQNYLAKISAFNSRKPSRYIARLAQYVISCIPDSEFTDYEEKEYYQYILEFSGKNRHVADNPIYDISRQDINNLMDLILSACDIDNTYVWQAIQSLKIMAETGGYNRFGANILEMEQASIDKEKEKRLAIIASLGPKPKDFIAAMQYEAKVISLMAAEGT